MGINVFYFSIVISLLLIGVTARSKYWKAGLWFSLAIIGQSAALQLIFAGPTIHYQHYRTTTELLGTTYRNFLFVIIIQAALVIWGLRTRWRSIITAITEALNWWQIGLLIGFSLVTSAALSRSYSNYVFEVFFAVSIELINLATLFLGVFAMSEAGMVVINQKIDSVLGKRGDVSASNKPKIGKFGFILSLLVFSLTACLSWFVYQRHPHVQDEVLYLYQARYLSQGEFTTPAPPVPEGFSVYMIPYRSEQWFSPFPPGWPALLGLGVKLKATWLVNPILSGVNLLLAYLLFQFIFSLRFARLSSLLFSMSPWFLFMGMNFMSHTMMLTCVLAAGVLVALVVKKNRPLLAILAGVFIGILSLIRPMDSIIVGTLLGVLLVLVSSRKIKMMASTGFLAGAILVGGLILPYNKLVTGDPFEMPLSKYFREYYGPKTYALGFGSDRGINWAIDPLPGYSPLEAGLNAALNSFSVNIELFGWSSGSLFLAALFLVGRYRFYTRLDLFFLAFIILTIGAYSLFWFNGGPDFGARYWYLLIIPMIYFTSRAVQTIEPPMGKFFNRWWGPRVVFSVLIFSGLACLIYLPWRAVNKYFNYLDMKPDIIKISQDYKFGNSLVLIQGRSHPDFESAWIYNPLDLRSPGTIYAFDRDPQVREALLKFYADRPIWVLQGPSITGNTYQVLAGPITAAQAEKIPR